MKVLIIICIHNKMDIELTAIIENSPRKRKMGNIKNLLWEIIGVG